jgi:hypothetical protein
VGGGEGGTTVRNGGGVTTVNVLVDVTVSACTSKMAAGSLIS